MNGFTCEPLVSISGENFLHQLNDYQGLFSMEFIQSAKVFIPGGTRSLLQNKSVRGHAVA
jgi:hypothetical protein